MKKCISLLLTTILVLSLAACGGGGEPSADSATPPADSATSPADSEPADSEPTPAAADGEGYNISVILKTTASEYWGYVQAGALAYMEEHPEVNVSVKGPTSETAYDEQMNMIETDLNNADIDAFIIAPLQGDMVANVISGQTRPIIAVDTRIEAPEIISFVGTGNKDAAALGGKAAVEAAKAAGWTELNAIMIAGVQGDSTAEDRMAGYKEGITAAGGTFLDDEVQYADCVADKAVTSMEAIMQNHPDGVAMIVSSNDDMVMAAARAAAANPAYEKTVFCGFDGIKSACEAILSGEETMSVGQEAYAMGYKAVEAIVGSLNGTKPDEFIDSGCLIVDASNAQERLDTLNGYLS